LAIDKLTISDTGMDTVSDTELDLQKGYIFAKVTKLTGASQYLIKIPNGIAGVRGTIFGLGANGQCDVYKHEVLLSTVGADGKPSTSLVGEGNSFNPGTGMVAPLLPSVMQLLHDTSIPLGTVFTASDGVSYCVNNNNNYYSK